MFSLMVLSFQTGRDVGAAAKIIFLSLLELAYVFQKFKM